MTKQELTDIRALMAEISDLERRLLSEKVTVSVQGSSQNYPYCKHGVVLEGYTAKSRSIAARLQYAKRSFSSRLEWIENIPDLLTRRIFQLRYVEGLLGKR